MSDIKYRTPKDSEMNAGFKCDLSTNGTWIPGSIVPIDEYGQIEWRSDDGKTKSSIHTFEMHHIPEGRVRCLDLPEYRTPELAELVPGYEPEYYNGTEWIKGNISREMDTSKIYFLPWGPRGDDLHISEFADIIRRSQFRVKVSGHEPNGLSWTPVKAGDELPKELVLAKNESKMLKFGFLSEWTNSSDVNRHYIRCDGDHDEWYDAATHYILVSDLLKLPEKK